MTVLSNFPEEVRSEVYEAQRGVCKVCENRIDDFHHKLSNTISNRKNFPLFTNSIFNCVGLCRGCHDSNIYQFKITTAEAAAYEYALRRCVEGGHK